MRHSKSSGCSRVYLGLASILLAACARPAGAGDGLGGSGAFAGLGGDAGSSGVPFGGAPSGGQGSGASSSSGGAAGGAGSAAGGAAGAAGAVSSGGVSSGGGGGSTSGGGGSASGGIGAGGSASGGTGAGGSASGGTGAGGSASGGGGSSAGGGGTGGTTPAPKSNCCESTPFVPGCTNPTVQACVCAKDPYCCSVDWDAKCASETLLFKCGVCPTPAVCCSAGNCISDAVAGCVANKDAACANSWTATCAAEVTTLGCGTCGTTPPAPVVWINELHYDDASTDAGEGVEVAGTAGLDLAGYSLVFYNGAPGQLKQYMQKTLSGLIPDQKNGFGTVWLAATNIQNGGADGVPEPDGVALVDKAGKVVQFVSYEGTFTPTDGPASGQLSLDIGKSELSTTPDGQSLGLTGTGKKYSDFTWTGPVAATPGQPNAGQSF
ncbi:MAG: hypothetical protein U0263_40775 [Polyangiaceae bacterium]